MSEFRGYGFGSAVKNTSQVLQNRVLRNTYCLLAISLIPTVLGAWIGINMGFSFFAHNPAIAFIGFLLISFGFFFAINKYKNSGVGVLLLLGFTFFMGFMLSRLLGTVLSFSNGADLVMLAFGGTAIIFAGMASIATVSNKDFLGLNKWLTMGVLVLILASVANIWLQLPALMLTISTLAIAIFSAFILYDVQRIVRGGETNYITATLSLYLNIYNIFVNILSILGIFGGSRE